jgi:parvulin-like peptidyl-prolyl isomerase
MRYRVVALTGVLVWSLHVPAVLRSEGQALPVRDGRPIVAMVNQQPVFLDELLSTVGPTADRAALRHGRGTADDLETLDRLITIRLVAQEATAMGLGEVPEIEMQVGVTSRQILRELLMEKLVEDVVADQQAVEGLFRETVREWKTSSLLFDDMAEASRAREEIARGASFSDVAAGAVAAGSAKADADATYHAEGDYLPEVTAGLAQLGIGDVTPVIRLRAGFVIVNVLDIRYPENAEARAEAERRILNEQQVESLEAHQERLRRQYVVVDDAVLGSLDYQAERPTLEALLQDTRVVATIQGGQAVTVADLTDYLRMQFFHGSDRASQRERMNEQKADALEATLGRRLLNAEAVRLGIDQTGAYRDRVTSYRESLLFDSFVQKVIAPGKGVTEDEVRQYYDRHASEFSYPAMLRVRSLAFERRRGVEDAMRALREGADFGWLQANAAGRLPVETPGLLRLDGQPVTVDSMPPPLRRALDGARPGDFRMYASPEGHYYLLGVQQVIESGARPYGDVREVIARKLHAQKLQEDLESYAGELRAQSKVETYLVRAR